MESGSYSRRVDEALALVADAFRGRLRKGTAIPYVCHLLQVATWVGEWGGDEEQFVAALLHDYLEDIDGASSEELMSRFGERVTRLVLALSDTTVRPKPPWEERKRAYIAHLATEPAEVKLVSACDKLHNARAIVRDLQAIGEELWGRFSATREQTLWYYAEVTEALALGWSHPLVDELRAAVREMHELARAHRNRGPARPSR